MNDTLAFNRENLELHLAGGHDHIDLVACTFAKKSLGKRRGDRDFAFFKVGLTFGDNGINLLGFSLIMLENHIVNKIIMVIA